MNPGGDFGKKELSPALRNRFTEIYVRPTTDENELTQILSKRLDPNLAEWASRMASVLVKVSQLGNNSGVRHVSIRDIISWASFMNAANGNCSEDVSFLHGLDAVVLDGIGVGTGQSESSALDLRNSFIGEIAKWVPNHAELLSAPFWSVFNSMQEPTLPAELQKSFYFGAPTTSRNLSKLMRASIVKKAVLLEGSPGVGKTSLVVALGCALGHPVVRINLSEQTDIMDLFGTFLPAPSDSKEGPQFMWSDGVLLCALKEGSWVVLDELNLASQTVLEGLNALLDHRSAVFIPELNKEFHAHENFRVFACQNPLIEGGGRKGLPRSFLNRFIKARIEAFERSDLLCIATAVCPDVEAALLEKMVDFVDELQHATMVKRAFGVRGSPWEFNLRDVLRWINMMQHYNEVRNPMYFADVLFVQRMRTEQDRERCRALLLSYFPDSVFSRPQNSDFLASRERRLL
ncbi:hypothetical protein AGDE_13628 [Angomonas deanei]|uniref:ATPase family associated with various cellular activities (AAA)/AAA domain (Dynein-related subfamily)/Midasin AAA lid domain containing protein, putative n=1 Tax=Angomonas deanei TaxID=59799 RepID=A0A7G2C6B5_9TRYP|nr:hypothetical protein AGDE_13628 [Angomonas deanei]CAD2215296.1 ATPase family associated with various cellular activities (AAA)/AAA domain (dynein-related subfamily)/Midasin AAA lid domain containing protein, putative [Angomonas deanei]|eukprot:EPY22064.1 hypothetical protein AGDE_13628 [Angomonas deanei]